jgi:HD-like signal output (HDOD) protein
MSDSSNQISALIEKYKKEPLLPLELPLIIQRINAENASVLDLKNQYYRDPLLCSYLIDLAWNKTKDKPNHPFAADHAMSTVGITDAKAYLSSININQASTSSKTELAAGSAQELTPELKFTMSSSLLAAELAKNLCKIQQKSNPIYWASMAHQFPDILLWHLKPKIMWRIQYRQIKLAKKLPVYEQAKLGFELNQWRQSVGKEWHMSEINHATFNKILPQRRRELLEYIKYGFNENTPSLKEWHHTDSWLVVTANWLARAILSPWLVNSYLHYSQIAKQAYSVNDKNFSQAIIHSIRTTSEHLQDSQLLVPAVSFLNLMAKPQYPEWINAAPKVPVKRQMKFVQKKGELTEYTNKLALQELIDNLKKNPKQFSNSYKLFRLVLDTCITNLGFSRACLLVVDWGKKDVTTSQYSKKEGLNNIKPEFDFNENTPLKKFLIEQGFLYFDKKKHGKVWHKLPKEIIKQDVENFILFSIKIKGRVNTLIYLDRHSQSPPSVEKIKTVKALLLTTSQVLNNI